MNLHGVVRNKTVEQKIIPSKSKTIDGLSGYAVAISSRHDRVDYSMTKGGIRLWLSVLLFILLLTGLTTFSSRLTPEAEADEDERIAESEVENGIEKSINKEEVLSNVYPTTFDEEQRLMQLAIKAANGFRDKIKQRKAESAAIKSKERGKESEVSPRVEEYLKTSVESAEKTSETKKKSRKFKEVSEDVSPETVTVESVTEPLPVVTEEEIPLSDKEHPTEQIKAKRSKRKRLKPEVLEAEPERETQQAEVIYQEEEISTDQPVTVPVVPVKLKHTKGKLHFKLDTSMTDKELFTEHMEEEEEKLPREIKMVRKKRKKESAEEMATQDNTLAFESKRIIKMKKTRGKVDDTESFVEDIEHLAAKKEDTHDHLTAEKEDTHDHLTAEKGDTHGIVKPIVKVKVRRSRGAAVVTQAMYDRGTADSIETEDISREVPIETKPKQCESEDVDSCDMDHEKDRGRRKYSTEINLQKNRMPLVEKKIGHQIKMHRRKGKGTEDEESEEDKGSVTKQIITHKTKSKDVDDEQVQKTGAKILTQIKMHKTKGTNVTDKSEQLEDEEKETLHKHVKVHRTKGKDVALDQEGEHARVYKSSGKDIRRVHRTKGKDIPPAQEDENARIHITRGKDILHNQEAEHVKVHRTQGKDIQQDQESVFTKAVVKNEIVKKVKAHRKSADDHKSKMITNREDRKILAELREADSAVDRLNLDEAINSYNSLLQKHPSSPRAHYGKAKAIDLQSELKKSNKLLEQCIEEYEQVLDLPDVPAVLYDMAAVRLVDRLKFRGWYERAVAVYQSLIAYHQSNNVTLLLDYATSLLVMGNPNEAKKILEKVLRKDAENGQAMVLYGFILKTVDHQLEEAVVFLQRGIESGESACQDARFYFQLGDALHRLNRSNEMIESEWRSIRDEAIALLGTRGTFAGEEENDSFSKEATQFELFSRGKKNSQNCARAPKTCAVVEKFPAAVTCTRCRVKFSVMHGPSKTWPGCGPTNTRLRAHLGLVVSTEPTIRVADQLRHWKRGKFIIFDDSFEHEMSYDGTGYKLVLIVDFWHPEIMPQQKVFLAPV